MEIYSIIVLFSLGVLIILKDRNDKLLKELISTIETIEKLSELDIIYGREWKWRYEKFEKDTNYSTYGLLLVWKPVNFFFKNKDYTK
jgi:hypothetical protein